MHIPQYLLPLAFAASSYGFLIPGDVDASVKDDSLPPAPLNLDKSKDLTLDCSTCPFALDSSRHGDHEWTNDVQSDLHVKIDTDGQSLRLNGNAFYPLQNGAPPKLYVSQTMKENEDTTFQAYPGDLRLSYSLEYEEKKADDGNSLLSVTMTVLALDGQMVRIDNVEVKAIKQADGSLVLHSVVAVPQDPNAPDAKCTNALCRVFAKLVAGINKAKAKVKTTCYNVKCFCVKCYKSVTGAIKHIHHKKPANAPVAPPPEADSEETPVKVPTHHKFRPGMFGGHPRHSHHRKGFFHRMGHVMWSTVKIAFMPILIGIAFGMAASAIGMLVGQLVVHLWMKYRRTDTVVYIPVDIDEKSDLPAYEDLATAEEVVEKENESKA